MGLDDASQPVAGDMGVDLGRGDVGVAQHLLDGAQIRPAIQQMGGEGVAQHMGRQAAGVDPGPRCQSLQQLRDPGGGQMAGRAARAEQMAIPGLWVSLYICVKFA